MEPLPIMYIVYLLCVHVLHKTSAGPRRVCCCCLLYARTTYALVRHANVTAITRHPRLNRNNFIRFVIFFFRSGPPTDSYTGWFLFLFIPPSCFQKLLFIVFSRVQIEMVKGGSLLLFSIEKGPEI